MDAAVEIVDVQAQFPQCRSILGGHRRWSRCRGGPDTSPCRPRRRVGFVVNFAVER